MAAKNYGTIAIIPAGEWDNTKEYKVGRVVSYNGSSYLAHTLPPVGTLPTNKNYWQVSAQGGGPASLDAPGTVQPDGETIGIDENSVISVKPATQSTPGITKGSDDITVAGDSALKINTDFEQATELANIIAGEAWTILLGKISKSIATTMNLDENALLKAMISNQYENITSKAASSALVYNLKQSFDALNSNLALKADKSDLTWKTYKNVAELELNNNCTMDQVVSALAIKGYAMLIAPIYKADFPNLNLAGAGQLHLLKVDCPILGYTAITDHDITNGVCYFTAHDGNGYKPWTSSKPI